MNVHKRLDTRQSKGLWNKFQISARIHADGTSKACTIHAAENRQAWLPHHEMSDA